MNRIFSLIIKTFSYIYVHITLRLIIIRIILKPSIRYLHITLSLIAIINPPEI